MKLTIKERKTPIPFTIAVVVLISIMLLLANQWRIICNAHKELNEEIAVMESLSLELDNINKLVEDKGLLMDRLDSLQNIIPSHKNHVDLLDYLISIFTEHNVQIIQLEFDSYIDKESYKELPVNLSMKGQYSDIIDVIEDFKMGSKPLRIDQLHMDKTDNHLTYCDLLAYAFISDKAD